MVRKGLICWYPSCISGTISLHLGSLVDNQVGNAMSGDGVGKDSYGSNCYITRTITNHSSYSLIYLTIIRLLMMIGDDTNR